MSTYYVWEPLFLEHDMGPFHPERPERLRTVKRVIDGDGVGREIKKLSVIPAAFEEVALVHDGAYIKRIEATRGKEVLLDPDTSTSASSCDAAFLAAGGAAQLAAAIWRGDASNGFAFVRPPGHHAERERSMGFCIFNNIAIAAEALRKMGVERIAIFDFDVHHGNGTQNHFYCRDDVYYASVHRFPFFPGTGDALEIGEGKGKGATLNIPLPVGSGDDEYIAAVNDKVLPAIEKFEPSILLISAGFDAHVRDPIGGLQVTTRGFRRIMKDIADFARDLCNGKLMFLLEGGYDMIALRECTEAGLEVLVEAAS